MEAEGEHWWTQDTSWTSGCLAAIAAVPGTYVTVVWSEGGMGYFSFFLNF
jgi:hypothetical protein